MSLWQRYVLHCCVYICTVFYVNSNSETDRRDGYSNSAMLNSATDCQVSLSGSNFPVRRAYAEPSSTAWLPVHQHNVIKDMTAVLTFKVHSMSTPADLNRHIRRGRDCWRSLTYLRWPFHCCSSRSSRVCHGYRYSAPAVRNSLPYKLLSLSYVSLLPLNLHLIGLISSVQPRRCTRSSSGVVNFCSSANLVIIWNRKSITLLCVILSVFLESTYIRVSPASSVR